MGLPLLLVFCSLFIVSIGTVYAITEADYFGQVDQDNLPIADTGDMFGYDIENIGDLDGNGVDDLVVVSYGCPDEDCNNEHHPDDGPADNWKNNFHLVIDGLSYPYYNGFYIPSNVPGTQKVDVVFIDDEVHFIDADRNGNNRKYGANGTSFTYNLQNGTDVHLKIFKNNSTFYAGLNPLALTEFNMTTAQASDPLYLDSSVATVDPINSLVHFGVSNSGDRHPAFQQSLSIMLMNSDGTVKDMKRITNDAAAGTGLGRAGFGVDEGHGDENCLDYHYGTGKTGSMLDEDWFVPWSNNSYEWKNATGNSPILDGRSSPWGWESVEYMGIYDFDGDGTKYNPQPTIALGAFTAHYGGKDTGAAILISLDNTPNSPNAGDMINCRVVAPGLNYLDPTTNGKWNNGTDIWFGWPLIASDVNQDGVMDLIGGQDNHGGPDNILLPGENPGDNLLPGADLDVLGCSSGTHTKAFIRDLHNTGNPGNFITDPEEIMCNPGEDEYHPFAVTHDLVILFMNPDGTVDSTAEIDPSEFDMNHRHYRWLEDGTSIDGKGQIVIGSSSGASNNQEGVWFLQLDDEGTLTKFNKLEPEDLENTDNPGLCTFENIRDNRNLHPDPYPYPEYIRTGVVQGPEESNNPYNPYYTIANKTTNPFEFPQVCNAGIGRSMSAVGDLNNDDTLDVLIADQQTSSVYAFYLGDGLSVKEVHKIVDEETQFNHENNNKDYFGHALAVWQNATQTGDNSVIMAIGAHEWDNPDAGNHLDDDDEYGGFFFYRFFDNLLNFNVYDMQNRTQSVNYTMTIVEGTEYFTGKIINIEDENPELVDTKITTFDSNYNLFNLNETTPTIGTYFIIYNATDAENRFKFIEETLIVSAEEPPVFSVEKDGEVYDSNFETTITFGDEYQVGEIKDVLVDDVEPIDYDETIIYQNSSPTVIADFNGKVINVGTYYVVYSVKDNTTGNITEITETVNVVLEITVLIPIENSGGGGGCNDCTPPTFGKNKAGAQVVTGGFAFNNVAPVDVTDFHTDFPLITVITNVTNSATVKVYENQGVSSIAMVQFGLGMPEIGSPLNDAQTLVEISLAGGDVDKIELVDSNNLVDVSNVATQIVKCSPDSSTDCLELSMQYVYRDQPKYNVMAINAMDLHRNSNTNYMNDGILVTGDSINDPVEQDIDVAKANSFYPQKSGLVTLTLVDYKTDMWQDEYGYMWSTDDYGPYLVDDIPRPIQEPDHFSEWSGYNDRLHSEFENYKSLQIENAISTISDMYYNHESFTTDPDFVMQKTVSVDLSLDYVPNCGMKKQIDRGHCEFAKLVEYEINRAQEMLEEMERMKDPSYYYEHKLDTASIVVPQDLKAILQQERIYGSQPIQVKNSFVDTSLKNNILSVTGNVGSGNVDAPVHLFVYYDDDSVYFTSIPVHDDGSFNIVKLSSPYHTLELIHDGKNLIEE